MSTDIILGTARKQTRVALISDWLDGGTLKIYNGSKPATPDTAITSQTLLATFTLATPSGTETNGVWTGTPPADVTVVADGEATWGRFADSGGAVVGDGDAGVTGSNNAIQLSSTTLTENGTASVSSISISEG